MYSLPDFGFLILFATIGGALAIRFKQPAVLGLLVMGAIIGPYNLGLVKESDTIQLFADLGAALLLFSIGIEFNVSKLSKLGMRVLLIAIFKLGIVFLLSYELGSLLNIFSGLGGLGPLYLGAILSITSTAIVVRILEQKEMIYRKEVPILVAALVVEDLFAIFALTVFSGLNSGQKLDSINLLISIFVAIFVLSVTYLVLLRVLRWIFDWLVKYQAGETMVLTALSLGVGLSYLTQSILSTASIGAFLAGSIVASLPKGEELERTISPFALVFSSLFFMSIGMLINIRTLGMFWELILIITVANILFKFVGTSFSAYFFGFSSKSAVFSGLAMLSMGEFSLLIAKEGQIALNRSAIAGTVVPDLVGIISVVVVLSSLATSFYVSRYEGIHVLSSAIMPASFKRRGRRFAAAMREITDAFETKGRFSAAFGRAANSILNNIGIIGLFLGVVALGWYLQNNVLSTYSVKILGTQLTAFSFIVIIVAIAIIFIAFRSLRFFKVEYNIVRLSLLERHRHDFSASHLASDFIKLLMVLALFIISPFLFSILDVPQFWSRILVIFIFLVLVWRFTDLIGFEKEKGLNNQMFFKSE